MAAREREYMIVNLCGTEYLYRANSQITQPARDALADLILNFDEIFYDMDEIEKAAIRDLPKLEDAIAFVLLRKIISRTGIDFDLLPISLRCYPMAQDYAS